MNEEMKVPEDIAVIIAEEIERVQAERQAKDEEAKRQAYERIMLGKARMEAYIEEQLQLVHEMLRPYCVGINWSDGSDEESFAFKFGGENDYFTNRPLRFEVPGLSPLIFSHEKNNATQWACLGAEAKEFTGEPGCMNWWNAFRRYERLETVLAVARSEWDKYQQFKADLVSRLERNAREAEAEERREAESWERSEAKRKEEKAEELALLDALKNDPIAMALMKAFVFIQQDRSGFEAQINDANESMASMEGFWSHKAADLRRRAEDADRRARDEESRVSNLQNDLDDAESKIKKMERGW